MIDRFGLLDTLRASYVQIGSPALVLLALSGGADSTALLHALAALREELGFDLRCLHVNHGLRAASNEEETFALNMAEQLKVPILLERVAVPSHASLEAAAREARYAAIQRALAATGAQAVALAHHADDQAETLLLNLLRGSGLKGLAGMATWRAPYWRPLLNTPRASLLSFLRDNKLAWVEDESNQDPAFTRNALRLSVMPALEGLRPGAALRMAQTAGLLRDELVALEDWQACWLKRYSKFSLPFHYVMLQPLRALPVAGQRHALRAAAARLSLALDFAQTESLRQMLDEQPGTRLNLPEGAYAFRTHNRLHILPDAVHLSLVSWPMPQACPYAGDLGDGRHSQAVASRVLPGAVMRAAHPQDRIQPLGMAGTQPVLKLLSARGVDRPFRPHWPVLARGHTVLWVPGLGIAGEATLTPDTREAALLRFEARLPDEINKLEA